MKITLEPLDQNNLEIAIKIQNEIFSNEHGDKDLINSVNGKIAKHFSLQKQFLVKAGKKYVGITGIYAYYEYPDDAWLAWFGIVEPERRKGYASEVFNIMLDMARERGCKYFRLYTDEVENSDAVKFYTHMGMKSEVYENPDDKCRHVGKMLVFSIPLNGKRVKKWNNKYLYLHEHDRLNKIH